MPRPPFIAISLLSACVLAYEVLLTRLFSIVLWHHFAYMIISAAMLGYGASGTLLTLLKEKIAPHFGLVYVLAAAALAVLMPAAFLLAQQVPFNPLELLWDKTQPAKLLVVYLLMMLPFFCGGLGIGLVFSHFGKQASRIYSCDILGAGAGSLGVIGVLFVVPPQQVLSALTALALLAAAIAVVELKVRPRHGAAKPTGAGVAASHLLPQTADFVGNVSKVRPRHGAAEPTGARSESAATTRWGEADGCGSGRIAPSPANGRLRR